MNIKYLVSGSTGYIGQNLINNINSNNVYILNRNSFKKNKVQIYNSNNELVELKKIENYKFDFFHLATHFSINKGEKLKIENANLHFSNEVLNFLKNLSVRKIIYTNTMFNYYKNKNLRDSYYSVTKQIFSNNLREFGKKNSIKIDEIFLDNTFGVKDKRKKVLPKIIESLKNNEPNPVNNPEAIINLVGINYVIKRLLIDSNQDLDYSRTSFISRNSFTLNSIYNFLKIYYHNNLVQKDILQIKENDYLLDFPTIDHKDIEFSPIHEELIKLF